MLPTLTVNLQGDQYALYTSLVDFVCMQINNCPHWKFATSVAWEDLPTNKFAIFYETETCQTGGKNHYYISGVVENDGTHAFQTPAAIRSYMVGTIDDHKRRPSRIVSSCVEERASLQDAASTLNGATSSSSDEIKWKTDDAAAAGGLSSNWSQPL
ncbi:uncharacterized protein PITG_22136 [Phytophthora infestans T30-4]|uniref:Uncharacterized protein n=1 Tax=Phytophthora infestans (strain T30-4) TaxID=403677 RepID=D0P4Z0_PHYIT|nr:uncharacterized protein PITG_22136 [Phytophthora infestans T30-4]EEY54701.1 conserved hypothetical protein [Phytophthora infestans T30-4]|eukprot:XP_002894708.1 conserved hypothetical protein [Phytophthora infestans T30-4]